MSCREFVNTIVKFSELLHNKIVMDGLTLRIAVDQNIIRNRHGDNLSAYLYFAENRKLSRCYERASEYALRLRTYQQKQLF